MAEYRHRNKKLGENMKNYEKLKLDMSQKINKLLKEKSEFESEKREFYENRDIEMSSPLKPMGQSALDAEQHKIEEEKQSLLDLQVKLVKKEEEALKQRAFEVIDFLNLKHLSNELAGNLSGGQKKLLELGRTMMVDAKIVLLDEL
jgi:ABC-type sugar transport system ATPase subunit